MKLLRNAYLSTATLGLLSLLDGTTLHTLERPWLAGGAPGGEPHVSCVPDGTYALLRHARPNGDVCVALRNPALGVFYSAASVPPTGGRCLILIHAANFVEELEGCIAAGFSRTIVGNRFMVTDSRRALAAVLREYHFGDNVLEIQPALGTA